MAETTPLSTLLSWTWVAFTMEIDNTVESEGTEPIGRLFRISTPMWANGMRLIDDDASRSASCGPGPGQRATSVASSVGGGSLWVTPAVRVALVTAAVAA